MGIDLHGVDTIIHYGAPSSIKDYFQASGRRGQSGDSAYSIVYRTPKQSAKLLAVIGQLPTLSSN